MIPITIGQIQFAGRLFDSLGLEKPDTAIWYCKRMLAAIDIDDPIWLAVFCALAIIELEQLKKPTQGLAYEWIGLFGHLPSFRLLT